MKACTDKETSNRVLTLPRVIFSSAGHHGRVIVEHNLEGGVKWHLRTNMPKVLRVLKKTRALVSRSEEEFQKLY